MSSNPQSFSKKDFDLVKPVSGASSVGNRKQYVEVLTAFNGAIKAYENTGWTAPPKSSAARQFSAAIQKAVITLAFDPAIVVGESGQVTYAGVNREISMLLTRILRIPQVRQGVLDTRNKFIEAHKNSSPELQAEWPEPLIAIGGKIAAGKLKEANRVIEVFLGSPGRLKKNSNELRAITRPFQDGYYSPKGPVSYATERPLHHITLAASGGADPSWNSKPTAEKVSDLSNVISAISVPETVPIASIDFSRGL